MIKVLICLLLSVANSEKAIVNFGGVFDFDNELQSDLANANFRRACQGTMVDDILVAENSSSDISDISATKGCGTGIKDESGKCMGRFLGCINLTLSENLSNEIDKEFEELEGRKESGEVVMINFKSLLGKSFRNLMSKIYTPQNYYYFDLFSASREDMEMLNRYLPISAVEYTKFSRGIATNVKQDTDKDIKDKGIKDKGIKDKDIIDRDIIDRDIIDRDIIDRDNKDNIKKKGIKDKDIKVIKDKVIKDKVIKDKVIKDRDIKDKAIKDRDIKDKLCTQRMVWQNLCLPTASSRAKRVEIDKMKRGLSNLMPNTSDGKPPKGKMMGKKIDGQKLANVNKTASAQKRGQPTEKGRSEMMSKHSVEEKGNKTAKHKEEPKIGEKQKQEIKIGEKQKQEIKIGEKQKQEIKIGEKARQRNYELPSFEGLPKEVEVLAEQYAKSLAILDTPICLTKRQGQAWMGVIAVHRDPPLNAEERKCAKLLSNRRSEVLPTKNSLSPSVMGYGLPQRLTRSTFNLREVGPTESPIQSRMRELLSSDRPSGAILKKFSLSRSEMDIAAQPCKSRRFSWTGVCINKEDDAAAKRELEQREAAKNREAKLDALQSNVWLVNFKKTHSIFKRFIIDEFKIRRYAAVGQNTWTVHWGTDYVHLNA